MAARSVALIGLYVLVGFFVYVWLAIPAGTGWDGHVHWGDVATWLGAASTLAAVCVALFLPRIEEARRDSVRKRVAASLFYDDADRLFHLCWGLSESISQAAAKRSESDVEAVAKMAARNNLRALDGLAKSADAYGEGDAQVIADAIATMRAVDRRMRIILRWRETKKAQPDISNDLISLAGTAARELTLAEESVRTARALLRRDGGRTIVDRFRPGDNQSETDERH